MASLPIVSDQQPQGPKEIILGDNAHLRKLGVAIDFAALGQEGYVIRTVGECLLIAGGQLRGNMYGVYGLLEDHLGCRWFTPGLSRIPKSTRLAVGPIDDRQVPVLKYREPNVYDCHDGDWFARNRVNPINGWMEAKHGGKVLFGQGLGCHTFARLVPPDKYYREHPEYFSLVKGQRKDGYAQLCCTNPDVIRICTEGIREAMRAQPDATMFSVSQNDCDNHCECPACQELARREDSQMAPVLQLVNRVAEAVEKEFPDKIVETLAYEWTRRPPKDLRPRPNVLIRICSAWCCFAHPLDKCDYPNNRSFCADLAGWAKIAPRLWVFDYTTDFHHYLLPFPNLRVRGPNIRFFVAHNVQGVYEADTPDTADSELAALGGYMTAKLLWNPNYDANLAINEFLSAYYGKAAAPIRTYIDLLHDRVERENIHVGEYAEVDSPHLNDPLLIQANELWQQAEGLVAGEPAVLDRVKVSRMSVDYAILERARLQAQEKLPKNDASMSLAAARLKPFCEVFQHSALTRLRAGYPVDKKAYCRDLARDLRIKME
ncbi:MAG: DUF4838 domain-containing protein [Planctomycetia bacterium]|nr:DUF4838 domain-containing protein [Planctomycetia bacterium]